MRDEWPRPSSGGQPQPVNLIENLCEYGEKYPSLIDKAGFPLSWAHYSHSMKHLTRSAALEKLRLCDAVNAAQGSTEYLQNWQKQERKTAGYL